MALKERARHVRHKRVLGGIIVLPVIVILSFLDIIPLSQLVTWLLLVVFIVSLIVFFTTFKGKNPFD